MAYLFFAISFFYVSKLYHAPKLSVDIGPVEQPGIHRVSYLQYIKVWPGETIAQSFNKPEHEREKLSLVFGDSSAAVCYVSVLLSSTSSTIIKHHATIALSEGRY